MVAHSMDVAKTRLTILQEISLFCVFLTIPLFRLGTTLLGSQTLTPAKILVVVTFLFWIANILINRDSKSIVTILREKANILILLFLAFTFISLINVKYFRDETVNEVFSRIKMLTLYFLIPGIIRDRQTLKRAILAFIIGSLLTTGVGLYEAATGKAFFKIYSTEFEKTANVYREGLVKTAYSGATRVQSLYSDPAMHAYSMVIFCGLALPWLFYSTSRKIKILVGILLGCYLINIIGTGARLGWISFGCALFVFLLLLKHRYKYRLWVISILSAVTLFLALSLVPHIPTLERLHTERDISLDWRLDTYRLALEMVRDYPLLGVGTGNYVAEYHNYLTSTPQLSHYIIRLLHNSYFQIWAENGTIGLLVFLFFMLTLFLGLLTAYQEAIDLEMKTIALSLLTAFTCFAVEFSGIAVLGQEPGWAILGLAIALISIVRKEREERYDKCGASLTLGEETSKEPRLDIEDADQLISQGRYAEAIDVYRRLLSIEPDNVLVLQRMEELKALLKLLEKG